MNRLKELREDRDLKQSEIAHIIGTTPATISRYESGEISLSPDLICTFCDYYHVTADYLLGRSNHPREVVSKMDHQILTAYHDAPLKIQKVILDLLELTDAADDEKSTSSAS